MRISKAKLNRRNKLFKIILPIVAILGAVGGYFILKYNYDNGGYRKYTEECENLAIANCIHIKNGETATTTTNNIDTFKGGRGGSFGGTKYRGSGGSSYNNTEYTNCLINYKLENCVPYYSGLGYVILSHIAMVAVLTGTAYFFIWITHG